MAWMVFHIREGSAIFAFIAACDNRFADVLSSIGYIIAHVENYNNPNGKKRGEFSLILHFYRITPIETVDQ